MEDDIQNIYQLSCFVGHPVCKKYKIMECSIKKLLIFSKLSYYINEGWGQKQGFV